MMASAFRREITKRQLLGHVVGVIVSEEVAAAIADLLPAELLAVYGRQADLPSIAAHLYEALRSFDLKPADCLLAEGTTEAGLGLAIMNRLHKASGFRTLSAKTGAFVK